MCNCVGCRVRGASGGGDGAAPAGPSPHAAVRALPAPAPAPRAPRAARAAVPAHGEHHTPPPATSSGALSVLYYKCITAYMRSL